MGQIELFNHLLYLKTLNGVQISILEAFEVWKKWALARLRNIINKLESKAE